MSMSGKADELKVSIANSSRVFARQVPKTYDEDVLDKIEAHPDWIGCQFLS